MAQKGLWKLAKEKCCSAEVRCPKCRQCTHKHCRYSAVQSVHKRGTHRTRLAQVTRIAVSSLFAWKESVIWSAHVSLFVALSLAVHHEHIIFLIHSSFYHDTRTRTTTGTTRSTPRTQYIINLSKASQSTSGAIKNHSGPKELATVSRISRINRSTTVI